MIFDWLTLGVIGVLFFSTLVRSAVGFGDALIAMPLLTIIAGLKTATPLVALVAVTISISILLRHWRSVRFASAWRLILASLVGIPLGLLMLKGFHEQYMKVLLAVLLVGFAAYSLWKPRMLNLKTERSSYAFGFIAGVLGGAYNYNGPAVVVYSALRRWPPETFRATLQSYLLVTGFLIAAGHGLGGLWNQSVLSLYAISLPVVFLSVYLGGLLHKRFPKETFDRYVYLLLIAIGALLFVNAIMLGG